MYTRSGGGSAPPSLLYHFAYIILHKRFISIHPVGNLGDLAENDPILAHVMKCGWNSHIFTKFNEFHVFAPPAPAGSASPSL